VPTALGLLAIAQTALLLLLLFSLPKSPGWITEVANSNEPMTLSFAVPPLEKENWQALIDKFESQNPDIRLEVVPGSDVTDALKAAYTTEFKNAEAKQAPASYDLIYTDVVWVAEFAKAGWLKELPDRFTKEQLDLFLPGEVEAGQYDGKLYRLPFRTDVGLLYYRKDLLKDAGYKPPETFDELLAASRSLQNNQRIKWGFVWQGQQYEGLVATFFEVLQGFGGFWIDPSRTVGLDQPEAIAAAQFLQRTITEKISPEDVITFKESDSAQQFLDKQAAFLRNWSNVWTQLESDPLESDPLLQSQVGILPMVHAPGVTSRACRGGWGFAVANRSRYPEAAFRAIQFFASEASQRQFILQDSYVPTIKKLFNDPEIVKRYPYFPELVDIIKNSASRPAIPEYEQISDILQNYLSKMLRKQLTAEGAMTEAAQKTRVALKG